MRDEERLDFHAELLGCRQCGISIGSSIKQSRLLGLVIPDQVSVYRHLVLTRRVVNRLRHGKEAPFTRVSSRLAQ